MIIHYLTPSPWNNTEFNITDMYRNILFKVEEASYPDIEMCCLARKALHILLHNPWSVVHDRGKFVATSRQEDKYEDHAIIKNEEGREDWDVAGRADPFTAVVDAWEYYKEHG